MAKSSELDFTSFRKKKQSVEAAPEKPETVLPPSSVPTPSAPRRTGGDIKKEDLIGPDEIAELVLYLVTHKGNGIVDELHIRRAAAAPWF